jgi:DNA-binding GntR family transcriptional regulator
VRTDDIGDGLPETISLLDKLRGAIYHGELVAGQRLVESELAQTYATSRAAVHEAIALLHNEGLVTRQRKRTAWVRAVTQEEAIEILEVRAVVEGLCAARAATRATEEDRRELRRLADEMAQAVARTDVLADSRLSDEIHAAIRQIAGQQTAAAIIDRLRHQGVRFQFHVSLLPGRLAQGAREHLDLVDAVIAGDAATAERLTREHFASVIASLHRLEATGFPTIAPAAQAT